tara:strand:- start:154 stop:321 length:168 start_codon:yes stop_codon:yes gene_type:complete
MLLGFAAVFGAAMPIKFSDLDCPLSCRRPDGMGGVCEGGGGGEGDGGSVATMPSP